MGMFTLFLHSPDYFLLTGMIWLEVLNFIKSGLIIGLTFYTKKGHIVGALFEAISFRVLEIIKALHSDSKIEVKTIKVDGGMTSSEEFLQTLADVSQIKVMKSKEQQTTILGAAIAAGLAPETQIWKDFEELEKFTTHEEIYNPQWERSIQDSKWKKWNKAVEKAKNWI